MDAAPLSSTVGRYYVQTFGCQMNMHDTARLEEELVRHGWESSATPENADLIVLNTCSVREKAEQKLRSEVGKLLPLKVANPELVIAVAGCVAQQEGEKLLRRIAHLDLVVGPDNLAELPALALLQKAGALPVARTVFDVEAPRFLAAWPAPASVSSASAAFSPAARAPRLGNGKGHALVSAFVTTMKGCDERCSFCVVPYTRGPERYRPAGEILDEIGRWVAAGAREIVLLGQTVDSYRDPALPPPENGDDPDETQFPALLRLIADRTPRHDPNRPSAPGLARLRYTSPHPRHATASLARAHAEVDLLARHVHLPVQSGSDRVLKRMIRRYTRAEYVERVARLGRARPGLTLSTDIIVGFPGETTDDFEQTLSLVKEVGFVSLFAFKFSPRPLTPALRLVDDVREEEKSERLARLFALADEQGTAHLASLVGSRQEVLVEGPSKASTGAPHLTGRTPRNEIVHVEAPPGRAAVGALVEVEIVGAYKHSLEGRITRQAFETLPDAEPEREGKTPRRELVVVP